MLSFALQHVGGNFVGLLAHFLQRKIDGAAADGQTAAAEGANAVLNNGRVTVDDRDIIYVDAQLVSGDLRECRFLALSMRRTSGQDRYLAGWFYAYRGALPSAGGSRSRWSDSAYLHISRYANAHQAAFFAGLFLLLAQFRISGHVERFLQSALIVAAVIEEAGCCFEREFAGGREVLAPDFHYILAQIGGHQVHGPLDYERGLGASCATVSIRGHLVGKDSSYVHLDCRNLVAPGEHEAGESRNRGRK